jgi:predicted NodU family carbamoyl transferase
MKTVVVWDIHWISMWKEVLKKEQDFDRFVFIGDYFDSFNIAVWEQISNFEDILKFYKENKAKVILLLGNHDFQYLPDIKETYSWFNPATKISVSHTLKHLLDKWIIKTHYKDDENKILFSHAWISKWWLDYNNIKKINKWNFSLESLLFNRYDHSHYWDYFLQSPIRIRPTALIDNMVDWYIQVVWHTRQKSINNMWDLWLIDALEHWCYITIEDWTIISKNLYQ